MAPPYHSMHRKLEDVLKQFLSKNEELPAKVYTFLEVVALGTAVEEPFVGIRCQHSTSTTPEVALLSGSGSRIISAQFRIRSHALPVTEAGKPLTVIKTFREVHDALVGKMLDCFLRDDLLTELNTIGSTIGGIVVEQIDQFEMTDEPEERSGVTEVVFPMYCHPAT